MAVIPLPHQDFAVRDGVGEQMCRAGRDQNHLEAKKQYF